MPKRTTNLYYEVRTIPIFGPPMPIASDIARHLQSRQFLGVTVVVCQSPLSMLSALRKQWLRLSRNLQKQRASTLNAEEILRFTHTITHMQHLQFAAQPPTQHADPGQIFFVTPHDLNALPPHCQSLYITAEPQATKLQTWIDAMAADGLVVDYAGNLGLDKLGLLPKADIETRMRRDWQTMLVFLEKHNVKMSELVVGNMIQSDKLDGALDSLLIVASEFLRRAAEFQHLLSLSQPLRDSSPHLLKQFETFMRLAHRVQTLTPGSFGDYLVKTFGDYHADSYFLRDAAPEADALLSQAQMPITSFFLHEPGARFVVEVI